MSERLTAKLPLLEFKTQHEHKKSPPNKKIEFLETFYSGLYIREKTFQIFPIAWRSRMYVNWLDFEFTYWLSRMVKFLFLSVRGERKPLGPGYTEVEWKRFQQWKYVRHSPADRKKHRSCWCHWKRHGHVWVIQWPLHFAQAYNNIHMVVCNQSPENQMTKARPPWERAETMKQFCMKIDLISQGRENVLFLPSNVAALTSHEVL